MRVASSYDTLLFTVTVCIFTAYSTDVISLRLVCSFDQQDEVLVTFFEGSLRFAVNGHAPSEPVAVP